jgi:hypothetical protein
VRSSTAAVHAACGCRQPCDHHVASLYTNGSESCDVACS